MSDDNDSFSLGTFLLGMGVGYFGTKALLDVHKQQLRENKLLTALDDITNEPDDDLDDDTYHPRQPPHKTKNKHKHDGDINTHVSQSYQLADNTLLGPYWLPPRSAIPLNKPQPDKRPNDITPFQIKAPAHQLPTKTTTNATYKTNAKWGISLGLGAMLLGRGLDELSSIGVVTFFFVELGSLLLYLWGCACWAKAKGRSGWLGTLLGILGLLGLLILLLLDDRAAPAKHQPIRTKFSTPSNHYSD